jgi:hypothetical protein
VPSGIHVVLEVRIGGDLLSPGEITLLHAFGCADCHYSHEV